MRASTEVKNFLLAIMNSRPRRLRSFECHYQPYSRRKSFSSLQVATLFCSLGFRMRWLNLLLIHLSKRSCVYSHFNLNFQLIYRASRDGWDCDKFHETCDNQGATVTIICSVGGFVFGGFSDAPWHNNNGKSVCEQIASPGGAFLFSLRCHEGVGPTRLNLSGAYNSAAMGGGAKCGPCFGETLSEQLVLGSTMGHDGSGTFASVAAGVYECPDSHKH
eukprot:22905_4